MGPADTVAPWSHDQALHPPSLPKKALGRRVALQVLALIHLAEAKFSGTNLPPNQRLQRLITEHLQPCTEVMCCATGSGGIWH